MSQYRQPTIAEAARLLRISLTDEYRADCRRYWRERYGEGYMIAVEKELTKRRKGAEDEPAIPKD